MMNSNWLYPLAFTLSAGLTPVVIAAARRWNLMDRPVPERSMIVRFPDRAW